MTLIAIETIQRKEASAGVRSNFESWHTIVSCRWYLIVHCAVRCGCWSSSIGWFFLRLLIASTAIVLLRSNCSIIA